MKKLGIALFVLLMLFGVSNFARAERDCRNDDNYDRQQSLVIYHYKDTNGSEERQVVAKSSDLPDQLKNKCWECWVDALEWFNCKEAAD